MFEEENQMGLFESSDPLTDQAIPKPQQAPPSPNQPSAAPATKPATKLATKSAPKPASKPNRNQAKRPAASSAPEVRKVSGLVPEGDVRLTANIRQDLHLKLKIASAHRRTTIGEIIEELIDAHL